MKRRLSFRVVPSSECPSRFFAHPPTHWPSGLQCHLTTGRRRRPHLDRRAPRSHTTSPCGLACGRRGRCFSAFKADSKGRLRALAHRRPQWPSRPFARMASRLSPSNRVIGPVTLSRSFQFMHSTLVTKTHRAETNAKFLDALPPKLEPPLDPERASMRLKPWLCLWKSPSGQINWRHAPHLS